MNKTQLIEAIASKVNVKKKEAETVVNGFIEVVTEALKNGEDVQVTGFGSFKVKERAAHEGRNPRTKETMLFPASKKASFSPSKALKETVNQ